MDLCAIQCICSRPYYDCVFYTWTCVLYNVYVAGHTMTVYFIHGPVCYTMYVQDPATQERYRRLKAENDAIENVRLILDCACPAHVPVPCLPPILPPSPLPSFLSPHSLLSPPSLPPSLPPLPSLSPHSLPLPSLPPSLPPSSGALREAGSTRPAVCQVSRPLSRGGRVRTAAGELETAPAAQRGHCQERRVEREGERDTTGKSCGT